MSLPDLDRHFPRYTEYQPHVPVWCVTPNAGRAIHRFFDTNPISPSGRYLAVFRLPFEDRRPVPGEVGHVCVIDLKTGEDKVVAETRGWEPQLGANVNWAGSDDALVFNDVDTETWQPFAWRLNPHTGERLRLSHTVYHCSPDGRWIVGGNAAAMCRTQYGYGTIVPETRVPRNVGLRDDDGFFLTDTRSGERHLLASVRTLVEQSNVNLGGPPEQFEVYPFHSKFNPQGDRLIVTLRWIPNTGEPRFDQIGSPHIRFAVLTIKPDGSDIHCAVGPEQWVKGGHHINFFPDGKRLSMNLKLDGKALWFCQVNADGADLRTIRDDVLGSGHPTIHPNGRHLLTDTYTAEGTAYGDGTIPLRWVDLQTGSVRNIVRINTKQTLSDATVMRIDPHPAWDSTWRYITFNAFAGATRRVFVADIKSLLA